MHPIIRFYLNDQSLKKELGFTHEDFLNGSDEWLETCHGHIQWTFPLEVASAYIKDAPLLTPEVINMFRNSSDLQDKLFDSFMYMCQFYGINPDDIHNPIEDHKKIFSWVTPRNHNFLRLTRMIRCLRMLGLPNLADNLHASLIELCNIPSLRAIITEETINYWNQANVESFDTSESTIDGATAQV